MSVRLPVAELKEFYWIWIPWISQCGGFSVDTYYTSTSLSKLYIIGTQSTLWTVDVKMVQSVTYAVGDTSCNTLFVPHNLLYSTSSWYPYHYIKKKPYHEHKSLYTVIFKTLPKRNAVIKCVGTPTCHHIYFPLFGPPFRLTALVCLSAHQSTHWPRQ